MSTRLRLMAVLAHPDDESLGLGGTLVKYATEGIETFLVTATRGEGGRYRGHRSGAEHPGPEALGRIREVELRAPAQAAYQEAFRKLVSRVDGVEREATAWPDWAITTVIDTRAFWPAVWRAVSCHASQITAYERLKDLSPASHQALWGWQSFYRA